MQKTPPRPAGKDTPSVPPAECPFSRLGDDTPIIRRQDLLDLGDKFKQSLAPAGGLIGLVSEQNETQRDTNRCVKVTSKQQTKHSWLLFLLSAIVLTVAVVQIHASIIQNRANIQQKEVAKSNVQTRKELEDVTKELRGLVKLAKKTGEQVEDIKEEQEDEPEVQLVAETDPVKAKRAPVKVRIIPRKPSRKAGARASSPPPTQATVELPINTKHMK